MNDGFGNVVMVFCVEDDCVVVDFSVVDFWVFVVSVDYGRYVDVFCYKIVCGFVVVVVIGKD